MDNAEVHDTLTDHASDGGEAFPLKPMEVASNQVGETRIDYVLVSDVDDATENKNEARRIFEDKLGKEHMVVREIESKHPGKKRYVAVTATWAALERGAEMLSLEKRIYKVPKDSQRKLESERRSRFAGFLYRILEKFFGVGHIAGPRCSSGHYNEYFTLPYNPERRHLFLPNGANTDHFFTTAECSMIVKGFLDRTSFNDIDDDDNYGIERMVTEGIYMAAFPLHDGPVDAELGSNDRAFLYEVWAKPCRWFRFQPLDMVRKYFGEKVALYFAWLGYYTAMLIPATIVGIIVLFYGIATLYSDVPSNEICDPSGIGNITLCPNCAHRCSYSTLQESCVYSKITHVFDNYATVAFAIFMSIWSVSFLEVWKRKQATYQYDWNIGDYDAEEPVRPDFEYKARRLAKMQEERGDDTARSTLFCCGKIQLESNEDLHQDPESGKMVDEESVKVPFHDIPFKKVFFWNCTSAIFVVFMISIVVAAIFGIVVYRAIMVIIFSSRDELQSYSALLTSASAAVINLAVILVLNKLYDVFAEILTQYEYHRTDTEYEDSLTIKKFLFKFVNFYGSTFYIAFFKGSFADFPIHNRATENIVGKLSWEQCNPSGCMVDLYLHLALVMVGKQAFNGFVELFKAYALIWGRKIYSWWKKSKNTSDACHRDHQWTEEERLLEFKRLGLYEEYLEMVIQFGFVTLFVTSFPLAPLFALINNIIEIRMDAHKMVCLTQRAPLQKACDIGVWQGILTGLSHIAIATNAFIIACTSDFIPKLVYQLMYSHDGSLAGYVDDSLAYFNTANYTTQPPPGQLGPVDTCRYKAYRYPPDDAVHAYKYTSQHWHVLCARLAFVVVFEHTCLALVAIISYIIPDRPPTINRLRLYKKQVVQRAVFHQIKKELAARTQLEGRARNVVQRTVHM